jgi:hypothetical protein
MNCSPASLGASEAARLEVIGGLKHGFLMVRNSGVTGMSVTAYGTPLEVYRKLLLLTPLAKSRP